VGENKELGTHSLEISSKIEKGVGVLQCKVQINKVEQRFFGVSYKRRLAVFQHHPTVAEEKRRLEVAIPESAERCGVFAILKIAC